MLQTAFPISLAQEQDGFAVHELREKSTREKISAELGFEPGATAGEARKLPLCYAAPWAVKLRLRPKYRQINPFTMYRRCRNGIILLRS